MLGLLLVMMEYGNYGKALTNQREKRVKPVHLIKLKRALIEEAFINVNDSKLDDRVVFVCYL